MHFTREPLIETIITPRDGFKLSLKSPNISEEILLDAVEVVSIGGSCFYRSKERPRAFLLPMADAELIEVRETRVVLKGATIEKGGIKIGSREAPKPKTDDEEEPKKRRRRRRRSKEESKKTEALEESASETSEAAEPPVVPKPLIPPPETLISETLPKPSVVPPPPPLAPVSLEKEESTPAT